MSSINVQLEDYVEPVAIFNVEKELVPAVNAIINDTRKENSILVGVGSAVYTVDEKGNMERIAGRLGYTDNRPHSDSLNSFNWQQFNDWGLDYDLSSSYYPISSPFNITSGLAQLPDGRLLVADFQHGCIQVIDKKHGSTVNRFAGHCKMSQNYPAQEPCTVVDGTFDEARFCNPFRLLYIEDENAVIVLDNSKKSLSVFVMVT